MRQAILEIPAFTSDDDAIAETQTPAGAGDLVLDGTLVANGVAELGGELPVDIESDSDDSGVVFVVIGDKADGAEVIEAVQGPNAGVSRTTQTFARVRRIAVNGACSGDITVGIDNEEGGIYSRWLPLDYVIADFNVGISVVVPDGATATGVGIEFTNGDVMDPGMDGVQPKKKASIFELFRGPFEAHAHPTLDGLSASLYGVLAGPVGAVRLVATSTDEPVRAIIRQAGHGNG